MNENILKLLKSDVEEDLMIGLLIIKDWPWERIQELGEDYSFTDYEGVLVSIRQNYKKDWNYQLPNFYCHRNSSLFIYKGKSNLKMTEYKTL